MPARYIAISGNIGVGKSSLTALLARDLGATAAYEPVAENPFLPDFYKDMPRWAFHCQVVFLTRRLIQQRQLQSQLQSGGLPIVQDRCLYEDAEIFARNLFRMGALSEREWQAYHDLFQTATSSLTPPDAIIYLRASTPTLLTRIHQRGRDYERGISAAYLSSLGALYDEWAAAFKLAPVTVIDADAIDFVNVPADYAALLAKLK